MNLLLASCYDMDLVLTGILTVMCFACGLMSLNTVMPALLLYPLVNGGIAVIVVIESCAIFREKLTLQRLLTSLVGLTAIVALNL